MPWLILVQVKGAVGHPAYQVVASVRLKVPWASHGRQFTKNSVTPPLLLHQSCLTLVPPRLNVDYARLENLTFSLELSASASNSLSIAVGTAAGDSLALDDADFEWGYDCGKWFRADTATGNVDECPELGNGRISRTLTIDRRDFNPQWNRLRIIKRGVGDVEVGLSYSREYTKFTIRIR